MDSSTALISSPIEENAKCDMSRADGFDDTKFQASIFWRNDHPNRVHSSISQGITQTYSKTSIIRPSQKYLLPNTKFRQCVQRNRDSDQSATKSTACITFPRENLELENFLIKSISKTGRREIFQCGQLVSLMHDKVELQGDDGLDINPDKRMTEE
ncbi:hypothetical protein VNO77_21889 [Canavalia gladiata]|uniref:Uncharacterized protein n=1 Tax=Canavalia gladiata TaxID=3824 RepID=A0AAN9QE01_CANGL